MIEIPIIVKCYKNHTIGKGGYKKIMACSYLQHCLWLVIGTLAHERTSTTREVNTLYLFGTKISLDLFTLRQRRRNRGLGSRKK